MSSSKLPAQPNKSVLDSIACLEALAESPAGIGVRPLSRQLGMEPTRVHRLLKTLASIGIAQQTGRGRYAPGPGLFALSARALTDSGLLRAALTPLRTLQETGRTVSMGVLSHREVCYLFHATPGMNPADSVGRVALFPAESSGLGMALLATRTWKEVRELYADHPPKIQGGLTALRQQWSQTREHGWACVMTNPESQHETLAVTVGEPAIAAIGLSGKPVRRQEKDFLKKLKTAATEITQALERGTHE